MGHVINPEREYRQQQMDNIITTLPPSLVLAEILNMELINLKDETLCLGCVVCATVCKSGAISVKPRPRQVLPPQTAFDRMVQRANESRKITDLILKCPEKFSYRAFARILSILEKTTPGKALIAIKPLQSMFFQQAIKILRIP